MSEPTNTQHTDTAAATPAAAGELRDVPANISEYQKFVAEGGNEHNEKILGREAAVAAAKAAGIVPDSEPGEAQEHQRKARGFQQRVGRLQRKIGERDATIADLRAQLARGADSNGAASEPARETAPPARTEPAARPNGEANTPPKPVETNFKTYGEYIEALTDWKTDRKIEAAEAARLETARARENEDKGKAITDAHNARVDEAKTRYPDWDKAFKGLTDDSFTNPMVVFIFESDKGPDVTYYLATHRDELERIAKLSPLRQGAALEKIEAQFASDDAAEGTDDKTDEGEEDETAGQSGVQVPKKNEPKPPPKRVSSAPPPAKPLGGKGGADDAMPDPRDFKAYEAWSKRQQARGVKR